MTILITFTFLVVVTVVTRIFQVYRFLKLVSKLCHIYDRNYVNEHGDIDINVVLDYIKKDYHLHAEWSAYNWMFFEGPSPYSIFFSNSSLTIEEQYGKEVVDRLARYTVFEIYELEKQNK